MRLTCKIDVVPFSQTLRQDVSYDARHGRHNAYSEDEHKTWFLGKRHLKPPNDYERHKEQKPVCDDSLGIDWEIYSILIKPYPLMAALHTPVECAKLLQGNHGTAMKHLDGIKSIAIEMGEGVHKKGG